MTPFPKERILTGLTYEAFLDRFEKQVQGETPNEITPDRRELLKLNLHRSKRVTRTTKISEELKTLVESITSPQIWLVLTEDWCGDSAQILPQIVRVAELNDQITLRILPRDENLDIMDVYLTNGNRAIPKLIAYNETGEELFTWGPRPIAAVELIKAEKDSGKSKEEWQKDLHLWYAKNRGEEVNSELTRILSELKAVA